MTHQRTVICYSLALGILLCTPSAKAKPSPMPTVPTAPGTLHEPNVVMTRTPGLLRHVYVGSFILSTVSQDAGLVIDASSDSILVQPGDTVVIAYPIKPPVEVGDTLYSYSAASAIKHPRTHKTIGYLTEVAGIMEVLAVHERQVIAKLRRSVMEVERGQHIAPLTQPLYQDIVTHPCSVPIEGDVVAVAHKLLLGSEQRLIFVDRGQDEGLHVGDILSLKGRKDTIHPPVGTTQAMAVAGEGVIVATQAHTSALLVTDALWEIAQGDKIFAEPPAK
jgi:hypothetical protein